MRFVHPETLDKSHAFERWKQVQGSSASFGELRDGWQSSPGVIDSPRSDLLKSLSDRQGGICAWTGESLEPGNHHLDHVIPQSVQPLRALDPNNLVAAVPQHPDPANRPYGAHHRLAYWRPTMVTPRTKDCGTRFRYGRAGGITGTDAGADETITALALNHRVLVLRRQKAIVGYNRRGRLPQDLLKLRQRIGVPVPGKLPAFAPAIADALWRHQQP